MSARGKFIRARSGLYVPQVSPTPTPTPSPSGWLSYAPAPAFSLPNLAAIPTFRTVDADGSFPKSASLYAAINEAPADTTAKIVCNPGDYGGFRLGLSYTAKQMNPGKRLYIVAATSLGAVGTMEDTPDDCVIGLRGCRGIYVVDWRAQATPTGNLTHDFTEITRMDGASSDCGFVRVKSSGQVQGGGSPTATYGYAFSLTGGCTDCSLLFCTAFETNYGVNIDACNNIDVIGTVLDHLGDDSIHTRGLWGGKIYMNVRKNTRVYNLNSHPDFYQDSRNLDDPTRMSKDLFIFNNALLADIQQAIETYVPGGYGNNQSLGRSEGIYIEGSAEFDDGSAVGATAGHASASNVVIADNLMMGAISNGLLVQGYGHSNITFEGVNEIYHLDAEPTPDDITTSAIRVLDGNATGSVNGIIRGHTINALNKAGAIANWPVSVDTVFPEMRLQDYQHGLDLLAAKEASFASYKTLLGV